MKSNIVILGITIGALLVAGCSTPQKTPASKAAKPAAPAVAPAAPKKAEPAVAPAPAAAPVAPVAVSPEAQALVERLTEPTDSGAQHEVVESTGFPQAMASLQPGAAAPSVDQPVNYNGQPPTRGLTADGATAELVERDWTGVVLVPVNAEFAKAYTSIVRLTSIEAHPLTDGRVRTWMRVRNVTSVIARVGVACRFMMKGQDEATTGRYYSLEIPVGEYRDVFFVSPAGSLSSYTVLVKAGN
jgi:hypothetical protein